MKKFLVLLVLAWSLSVVDANSQNGTGPKFIPIIDEPTRKAITDSYKAVVEADKDFQITLLKAKLKYKVDESWVLDLSTMRFNPPEPKPVEKK